MDGKFLGLDYLKRIQKKIIAFFCETFAENWDQSCSHLKKPLKLYEFFEKLTEKCLIFLK